MSFVNIIMYHYVRDLKLSRYPSIKGLDAKMFRQQLEFIKSRFVVIRMEDLLSALNGDVLPKNAALLTFDDGYIDHYTTVFPLLDEMGIQGSFFPPSRVLDKHVLLDVNKIHFVLASVNPCELFNTLVSEIDFHRGLEFIFPDTETLKNEYAIPDRFDCKEVVFIKKMLQTVLPERLRAMIADKLFRKYVDVGEDVLAKELYCDISQLTVMKKHGMFIGIHGFNHGWLGNMEKTDYETDISQALTFMGNCRLIDKGTWVMNYPYGSWNDGVLEYIKRNGCLAGLTTQVGVANLHKDNRLLLPRLDTNDFPPKSDNYKVFNSDAEDAKK